MFLILKILRPNTIGVCAENELRLRFLKQLSKYRFKSRFDDGNCRQTVVFQYRKCFTVPQNVMKLMLPEIEYETIML